MVIRIFISYSQEDFKPEARYLCNYLSKHIPDSDVFIDQLKPRGSKWQEENDRKLNESDVFLVILTNGGLTSKEVKREVKLAKNEPNRRIIPCKDELLKMNWSEMPYDLGEYDGLEFERKEELGRKLVGEIRGQIIQKTQKIIKNSSHEKPIRILGIPNTNFNLNYSITNGEILSATIDRDSSSLIIALTTYGDGTLELTLPRNLIDAKKDGQTDQFFVLVNGKEITFEERIDEVSRILTMSLTHGAEEVEVIGTEVLGTSFVGIPASENIIRILKDSSTPHDGKYLDKEVLTIKAGEKVRWINEDSAAHTITSGSPSEGPDGCFDSSLFMAGNSFDVTFTTPGSFDYFCMVHPWKTGKILVK